MMKVRNAYISQAKTFEQAIEEFQRERARGLGLGGLYDCAYTINEDNTASIFIIRPKEKIEFTLLLSKVGVFIRIEELI